jgi:hypothetical protein
VICRDKAQSPAGERATGQGSGVCVRCSSPSLALSSPWHPLALAGSGPPLTATLACSTPLSATCCLDMDVGWADHYRGTSVCLRGDVPVFRGVPRSLVVPIAGARNGNGRTVLALTILTASQRSSSLRSSFRQGRLGRKILPTRERERQCTITTPESPQQFLHIHSHRIRIRIRIRISHFRIRIPQLVAVPYSWRQGPTA